MLPLFSTSGPSNTEVLLRYLSCQITELQSSVTRLHDLLISGEAIHSDPKINHIVDVCANAFGVTKAAVMSRNRMQSVVLARQSAMWVLRNKGMTLQQIGEVIGRDHSGVAAGLRSLDDKLTTDKTLAAKVREKIQGKVLVKS